MRMQQNFIRTLRFSAFFRQVIGACVALSLFFSSSAAFAQSLIRDEEIEHTLRTYAAPIFQKAGLDPNAVDIYIVNDDTINAFVMGGSNVFINTGLIMECTTPDMLIGVLAHETGHIAGGHLVRTSQAVEKARMKALIGSLLGAAAMAGGAGDVGAAVMSASQNTAMRGLFSHTRSNEQAADQAALRYLDELDISAVGMLQTFEILRKLENRKMGRPDPYLRTHPLSADRIMHLRGHIEQSTIPAHQVPAAYPDMHERMLAKLKGFLGNPQQVLHDYPASDQSVEARYARTVALYRIPDLAKALVEINSLLAEFPKDPFFHELKGQILFEHGHIEEAQTSYEEAARLMQDAPLIRTELAKTYIAQNDDSKLPQAIMHLEYATSADPSNPQAWRLLATAYGKQGKLDVSHLALAEEALLLSDPELAIQQLDYAKKYIKPGTPASLRIEDLRTQAEKMEEDKKKKS